MRSWRIGWNVQRIRGELDLTVIEVRLAGGEEILPNAARSLRKIQFTKEWGAIQTPPMRARLGRFRSFRPSVLGRFDEARQSPG
jgi:hypothetical protein